MISMAVLCRAAHGVRIVSTDVTRMPCGELGGGNAGRGQWGDSIIVNPQRFQEQSTTASGHPGTACTLRGWQHSYAGEIDKIKP